MSHDLDQILIVAKEGSHVLLYQDAVLAAADTPENRTWLESISENGVKVHVLKEDLSARGVKRPMDGIAIIDYGGWVDLVEGATPVSW
jgi:tRNA 2-thiouridine synthesizing protein B